MAKVYGLPEGIDAPDFAESLVDGRYNMEQDDKVHAVFIEKVREWCKSTGQGDLVGELVHFPIADGAAVYMVWKNNPLSLIHLPIHDAWSIPDAHARGLRVSDIRGMVEREKKLASIFGRA